MTKAMNQVLQWQGPLKAKLGMVLPLGDRLVDAPASLNFYKNLAVENGGSKRLLDFPGFYHEALNDTDKSIVFNALESFYL